MATIKEWLDEKGFDWENGRIIWQPTDPDGGCPGWGTPIDARAIPPYHSVLTQEFYHGHGLPECPRFVAEDEEAIYFPVQYDGATWLEKVWKDLEKYLDYEENRTPYPGG